jgi:hypothetical protein
MLGEEKMFSNEIFEFVHILTYHDEMLLGCLCCVIVIMEFI